MSDILNKLRIHSRLNQKIWKNEKLKPLIRQRLLKIADDFIDDLGIEIIVEDIVFTGSLANYNYSIHSDIDLHVILDFKLIDENEDLVRDFLLAKKSVWNDTHTITVKGAEVEMYAENIGDPHHSTGVYSVLNDDWIKKPNPNQPEKIIDYFAVLQKADSLIDQINYTLSLGSLNKLEKINLLKDKIKRIRKCGLEKAGEYSVENLAFKILRNEGHIERLWKEAIRLKDDMLSLESSKH